MFEGQQLPPSSEGQMEATAATAPNAVAKDPRQRYLEIKAAKHPAKQTLCFAITRLSLSCRARKLLQTSSGAIDEFVRCIRLRLQGRPLVHWLRLLVTTSLQLVFCGSSTFLLSLLCQQVSLFVP